jgi:protein KRI1
MPRPKKNKTAPVDRGPSAQLLAEKHPMPTVPTTKTKLLDDSDSEQEFHSAQQSPAEDGFKINEEYARRFEHNKKREELHKCTCGHPLPKNVR